MSKILHNFVLSGLMCRTHAASFVKVTWFTCYLKCSNSGLWCFAPFFCPMDVGEHLSASIEGWQIGRTPIVLSKKIEQENQPKETKELLRLTTQGINVPVWLAASQRAACSSEDTSKPRYYYLLFVSIAISVYEFLVLQHGDQ
jgi:hypothetical protein